METYKPKSIKQELKELRAYKEMNEKKIVGENKERIKEINKGKYMEIVRRLDDVELQLKTKQINEVSQGWQGGLKSYNEMINEAESIKITLKYGNGKDFCGEDELIRFFEMTKEKVEKLKKDALKPYEFLLT